MINNIHIAQQERLLSHAIVQEDIDVTVEKIITRIKQEGDKPHVTVARQIDLLEQLSQFDFGRFMLQNRGLNGYWTHYLLTYPWRKSTTEYVTELERFLLERAPTMLATQQRFQIFLKENQQIVKDNRCLACIPCGMMGELLYLDYSSINDIELVGIDYDLDTFKDAAYLAQQRQLIKFVKTHLIDAWALNISQRFDLISSNGLNIYEDNNERVTALYHQFYQALKPGGKLVTSFLTPPPNMTDSCEWDMGQVNQADMLLQKIIFIDLVNAKWRCFRSSTQTQRQLESVGFADIRFVYDKARQFPTVIASKSSG